MDIPEFTAEDYLTGTAPYDYVINIDDDFGREQAITYLHIKAKQVVGDKSFSFKTMLKLYASKKNVVLGEHYTDFTGQPKRLNIGKRYVADDSGVRYVTESSSQVVCMHPILPVARLVNVETGEYGLEIAYRHEGQAWQTMAFPREDLSSSSRIVSLAKYDVGVTSDNAKALSTYINSVQEMNYDDLPEKKSIGRLGWVGTDFVPYCDKYVFEVAGSARQIYDSVRAHGSRKEWLDAVLDIRQSDNVVPRIVMAASLASVLIKPLGALPFIVHLWGKTGTGKTLALMLAASIWANPEGGKFIHTFNATAVGLERTAAFLHDLPILLDELQTIRNRGDFEDTMYQLTEGTGRARGNKDSSLRETGEWRCAGITTGEQPITSANSGGGTVNRIIEVDCSEIDMFDNPHQFANIMRANYGYIGEEYIEILQKDGIMDIAKAKQEQFRDMIYNAKHSVPEKQAIAGSLILTADYLVTKFIFKDDRSLEVEDMAQYLISNDDVDKDLRAYEWLQGWISENTMHFIEEADEEDEDIRTQLYGKVMDNGNLAIIHSVFNDACEDAGFGSTSLARWLKHNGYSDCDKDRGCRFDKNVRVGSALCRCIVLKSTEQMNFEEVMDTEEVPW